MWKKERERERERKKERKKERKRERERERESRCETLEMEDLYRKLFLTRRKKKLSCCAKFKQKLSSTFCCVILGYEALDGVMNLLDNTISIYWMLSNEPLIKAVT